VCRWIIHGAGFGAGGWQGAALPLSTSPVSGPPCRLSRGSQGPDLLPGFRSLRTGSSGAPSLARPPAGEHPQQKDICHYIRKAAPGVLQESTIGISGLRGEQWAGGGPPA